jgi:hypothetical protein
MPVPCARCNMPLPKWDLLRGDGPDCPACHSQNRVRLFPAALAQSATPSAAEALDGEAACFDHPGKRATAVCERCGRFVCQLCAVEMGAGVSCPSCVANPQDRVRQPDGDRARTLYDTWALTIPLGLMILWPLTVLSAPTVVALAFMKWKQPISLVRRNRWRFVAGLAVALTQGGLWIALTWYFVAKTRAGA